MFIVQQMVMSNAIIATVLVSECFPVTLTVTLTLTNVIWRMIGLTLT